MTDVLEAATFFPEWQQFRIGLDLRVRQSQVGVNNVKLQWGIVSGNGMIGFLAGGYGLVLESDPAVNAGRWRRRSVKNEGGAEAPPGPDTGVDFGVGIWRVLGIRYSTITRTLEFLQDGLPIHTVTIADGLYPFVPTATFNPIFGLGLGPESVLANDRIIWLGGHRYFIQALTTPGI